MTQNALIKIPKLNLLFAPKQDSNLNNMFIMLMKPKSLK
jgi:hypothetical protein